MRAQEKCENEANLGREEKTLGRRGTQINADRRKLQKRSQFWGLSFVCNKLRRAGRLDPPRRWRWCRGPGWRARLFSWEGSLKVGGPSVSMMARSTKESGAARMRSVRNRQKTRGELYFRGQGTALTARSDGSAQ